MRVSYLTTLLLPTVILAAPTILDTRADEPCAPTSYSLSDYTLDISSTAASVNFTLQSTFTDTTAIQDAVITGANCHAEGASIPNNNVCDVANRKLLFDLRDRQEKAHYQITHTWICNGYVLLLSLYYLA
jgi:hypothetical protein